MEYYIIENNERQGPFTLEELPKHNITAQTMVWSVGFTAWKQAKDVPELAGILSEMPPSITTSVAMPKTWLVESILVTCFCCLPFGVVGIIYSTKIEPLYQRGQYEQAQHYSELAKKWTLWGLFSMVAFIVLYLIVIVVAVAVSQL